MDNLTAMF